MIGCDAVAISDLHEIYEDEASVSAINVIPFYQPVQVKNSGIVILSSDGKVQFREKPGEKVMASPFEYSSKVEINGGATKEPFLVNPQLYAFNPVVFAVLEALIEGGLDPDWGNHVLPILADAGLLKVRIMKVGETIAESQEYWRDIGDLGTFLETAMDILRGDGPLSRIDIPVPTGIPVSTVGGELGPRQFRGYHGVIQPGFQPIIEGGLWLNGKILGKAGLTNAVVEWGAEIHGRAKVFNSIIFENSKIYGEVWESIIGPRVIIPEGAVIQGEAVIMIGEDELGPIILSTKIPYTREALKLPLNEAPAMPHRRFW